MESLGIRIYGSNVLRAGSEPVEEFGDELSEFLLRMVGTMLSADGVGLAAPQVGVSRRITVINPEPENEKTLIKMVNPKIVAFSDEPNRSRRGASACRGFGAMLFAPSRWR